MRSFFWYFKTRRRVKSNTHTHILSWSRYFWQAWCARGELLLVWRHRGKHRGVNIQDPVEKSLRGDKLMLFEVMSPVPIWPAFFADRKFRVSHWIHIFEPWKCDTTISHDFCMLVLKFIQLREPINSRRESVMMWRIFETAEVSSSWTRWPVLAHGHILRASILCMRFPSSLIKTPFWWVPVTLAWLINIINRVSSILRLKVHIGMMTRLGMVDSSRGVIGRDRAPWSGRKISTQYLSTVLTHQWHHLNPPPLYELYYYVASQYLIYPYIYIYLLL